MATLTSQALAERRSAISCCMCLLLFIVTVATVNEPTLVKADHKSPPSTLVLYILLDSSTVVVVNSPSGSYNASEYGTVTISDSIVRDGPADNSPVLGESVGHTTTRKDGSFYVDFTYVLQNTNYAGSITGQGVTDSAGNGELAITGGTGDFRGADGYVELRSIAAKGTNVLFQSTVYFIQD